MTSKKVSISDSYMEELSKRVRRKSKRTFFEELNQIQSYISEIYELYKETEKSNRQLLYEKVCGALSIFADVTDWLADKLMVEKRESKETIFKLEGKWIFTAKQIIKMLEDTALADTTYEDSLGMPSDYSISNLFRNVKGYKDEKKPYFPDVLCRAAEILFENGELEFAQRYALMAVIEALWDPYRYEKDDVFSALMQIPYNLEEEGMYDKSAMYITRMLKWLYAFYSKWGLQEAADIYITMLQHELVNRWDKITDKTKRKVTEFWKEAIKVVVEQFKGWVVFDDYLMSYLIETLARSGMYKEAFEIVEARIATLVAYGASSAGLSRSRIDGLLQNLESLAKLGFDLKDRKITFLKKSLHLMRSNYLEDRVSKLAHCMGYSEEGYKVWEFEDPTLYDFIKNRKTITVEIDVHRFKTEHVGGKERKILLIAECKYRNKPATAKDVRFFLQKARDLLNNERDSVKRLPEKLAPKIGELWFVSVNGFKRNALSNIFKIGDTRLKPLNIVKLNEMLRNNNLPIVPIS